MKAKVIGAMVAVLSWGNAFGDAPPSFQGLGFLSPTPILGSFAQGISSDGRVVVGTSYINDSAGTQAFRWTKETGMVSIGDLPGGGVNATAHAASADGAVIVGESISDNNRMAAFRWTEATGMVGLGSLGGNDSRAFAVSADGSVVVGRSYTLSEGAAFRWTATSGMSNIGNLGGVEGQPPAPYSCAFGVSADGSVVVGGSYSPSGFEAFSYSQATGMVGHGDLAGGDFHSYFRAVSPDASVMVGFSYSNRGGEAVRWSKGTGMVGLGDLPGGMFYSDALDLSADGSIIVGYGRTTGPEDEAFIWDSAHGMRNLKYVLTNEYHLNLLGWTLREAVAISDDGCTITGTGWNPADNPEAWVAIIPEPATLSLLALGGLAVIRRRGIWLNAQTGGSRL